MTKFSIGLKFEIQVEIKRKGDWFLASCCSLDVHSQGRTEGEAKINIEEALKLFFISCLERHTFDDVMKECGISVDKKVEYHKEKTNRHLIGVEIPIYLLANHRDHCECHA
jgi:predicted RNase H-like HicB family nuclease